MRRRPCSPIWIAPLIFGSCAAPRAIDTVPARAPWASTPLEHAVSIREGRSGARVSVGELLDALARADAVFLGETHIDETTHEVELAVYDGLLARRSGHVVLALEMFERDEQPALDAYVAGKVDEATFLERTRPWSNYRTAYRPLIERARLGEHPVVASNFPAPLRGKLPGEGVAWQDGWKPDERPLVPADLRANTPAYWRRVDNAIRGHIGMMGGKPAPDDPRLTSTQSLWDNSMGEACALALQRNPGHTVLHVNGGFHSEYWDGTARQLRLRRPDARVLTVAIVPASNPDAAELGGLPVADYVVFAEERAQDVNEGTYAVFVPRELHYRLHVPAQASDSARVPLLIWLSDDGESAEDALALWKKRLGDACAIAVIEAPYRETQDDLTEGGRWFWPDSFEADVAALREGIERTWGYVLRHQPVLPGRVVLAGEGTGATVIAAATLQSEELAVSALALAPRRYAGIKDFPLPLPELRGDDPPVSKSLRLLIGHDDETWWRAELAEYAAIGFESSLAVGGDDPWREEIERENAVRAQLGIAARTLPPDAQRAHVVLSESRRARAWARLLALEHARRGELVALLTAPPPESGSRPIELVVHAREYAEGTPLPRAPGAFGGTTVVVLPEASTAAEVESWFALQAADPLAKASRFHRLVVATTSGERALPIVLKELAEKKRKNVLIVPAVWSADGATLRALRSSVRAFEDQMTVHWRPGLGGPGGD